jgi:hypothetical protein
MGLEPATPGFEEANTLEALDHAYGHCDRRNVVT